MTSNLDVKLSEILRDLAVLHNAIEKHVLSQHGLRRSRYYILYHLYHTPHRTLGQVSELTLLYTASVSRTVYSMEQEGLVQREIDPNDRRQFTLSLTAAGTKFYETVTADLHADIKKRFASLSQAEKETLLTQNTRLRDILDAHQTWLDR